ncbi:MAG: hypothetical protein CME63_11230 [Halobacteriovoraceae bacterium]|nr:hypothetical protein [Halobacteriovoraceae bacterium]|tara:strand:- start:2319 stop:3167 length:849 start_codon:yes stop_codon:yes gene_type:complete
MNWITDFITFPFLQKALIGCLILAVICGVLSPMIVAKRFAFMGSSIAHGALLGVSIALFLIDYILPPESPMTSLFVFAITTLVTLVAATPLALTTFRQKLPSDALIGLFFTATMGLGLLIHQSLGPGKGDLLSYLFGNILMLSTIDLMILLILGLLIFFLIWIKRSHWILFLYDEEAAFIQGLPTKRYHLIFFLLLTLVIVSGLKISGVILINSFLLIPGLFALKFAPSAKSTFTYSLGFSLMSALTGVILANGLNLSTGPTLAVTQVIFYLGSQIRDLRRH